MEQSDDVIHDYIATIDLSGVPRLGHQGFAPSPPRFVPLADVAQGAVVGSTLLAHAKNVEPATRSHVLNSMLLAQLASRDHTGGTAAEWMSRYLDVLSHIGFVVLREGATQSKVGATRAEVDQVVLKIAAAYIGGTLTAAYQLIDRIVTALIGQADDSGSVTVFRRESQESAGRFQLSTVEQDDDASLKVTLVAFAVDASSLDGTTLLFRHKTESAAVTSAYAQLTPAADAVMRSADAVAAKVAAHRDGYIRDLVLPEPPV